MINANTYELIINDVLDTIQEMREAGDYDENTLETMEWKLKAPEGNEGRKCTSCSDPAAPGWHVDDDAGITFGGLKKAQNEAMDEIAQYIAHIYFTKSTEVFNDLMESIANEPLSVGKYGGYLETCEWLAGKAQAKPDEWCASCNYLLPVADYIRRDDSRDDEPLCAECLARVNGGN